ncbi:MAG: iron uptake porin [Pseudanabaenaceae cyanobacterium]|jgi:hypothetical protein
MKKISVLTGIGFAAILGASAPAMAQTVSSVTVQDVVQSSNNEALAQRITSVNDMTDVKPTDWAYGALQNLTTKYNCISGYPDKTFRGRNTLTRFEFAAALNQCLESFSAQISAGTGDRISKADLVTIQKLQDDFAAELKNLSGRVDSIEAKVNKIEAQQFSTTTKLTGEAIMAVTGASGASVPTAAATATNTFIASRVRLNLNTSFTGSDLLLTRLEVGNGSGSVPGALYPAGLTGLGAAGNADVNKYGQDYAALGNNFVLGKLRYDFNAGRDLKLSVGPVMHAYDHIDTNSFANNESVDFSSTFFINNPLHVLVNPQTGGAGAAFDWNLNQSAFTLRGLYLAGNGNNANQGASIGGQVTNRGLFGDAYQGTVELEYAPKVGADGSKPFALKLQYTNGSINNTTVNAGGVNLEWAMNKSVGLFGRYGFGTIDYRTAANAAALTGGAVATSSISPNSWMAGFSFNDLFKPGALAGVGVGQPLSGYGNSTQTNLELFYNLPVTSNIRITPDVQFIFNPNNNSTNSTIFIGTLRTVFTF